MQFLIFYSTVQYSTVQCNATHHEALPGLAAGAGGRDGHPEGGSVETRQYMRQQV